jgi:DNA gyrase subunit B
MSEKQPSSYDSTSIISLKDLEPVRTRPALFLGDTTDGSALHRCFFEVFDNAVDEFLAGHATKIDITLGKENTITIEDDGRGIPVDIKKEEGISALQVVMCTLNAGGKFDNKAYEISSGLHGIGVSAVNAVSEWLKAEVRRDDKVWFQEYQKGIPKSKVKAIGQCTRKTGTKITFKPDEEIFKENNKFDSKKILNRIREVAYLNVGLEISFIDETSSSQEEIVFKDKEGLTSFIKHLRDEKVPINDIITISHRDEEKKISVDLALQWVNAQFTNGVNCFTNTVRNTDGGTHLQGFRTGLNRAINKINDEKKWVRGIKDGIKVDDSITGLIAIVSVKMQGASFSSQTKDKLVNSEVKGFVDYVVCEAIYQFFSEHNRTGKAVVSRIALSAKAREAARKAKEKVFSSEEFSSIGTLPGKLADCSEKDPEKRELFILEGQSAGGSAKNGRDRKIQSIYPMRGKILNIEKAKIEKIIQNEEIKNIMTVVGAKISKDGNVDLSNVNYHKVIILTDADIDGAHIRTLLLTLFYRYMKEVIEKGFLYVACPPLYKIVTRKENIYASNENELKKITKSMKEGTYRVTRFKGIGEMNEDDLWQTTLNPEVRTIKKISIEDAQDAEDIVSLLMGNDIEIRKQWIEQNAVYVENLDI